MALPPVSSSLLDLHRGEKPPPILSACQKTLPEHSFKQPSPLIEGVLVTLALVMTTIITAAAQEEEQLAEVLPSSADCFPALTIAVSTISLYILLVQMQQKQHSSVPVVIEGLLVTCVLGAAAYFSCDLQEDVVSYEMGQTHDLARAATLGSVVLIMYALLVSTPTMYLHDICDGVYLPDKERCFMSRVPSLNHIH